MDTRTGDADVAAIGALLGDPGRCRMLVALGDGRALPAGRLAAEAGVSAATASGHLARLVEGGLLAAERHGRFRYYRLAGPEVGRLLEDLTGLAPPLPVRSLREGTRAHALRAARSCYDHLAGRLGVAVMGSLLERGHLDGGDGGRDPGSGDRLPTDPRVGSGHDHDYRLTPAGLELLGSLGVGLPARPAVRYCVDWTEQRHHLAGAPGRALLARLVELDWVRRAEADRAVLVTPAGRDGLAGAFGLGDEVLAAAAR
jgi:DNA-binding transcriptional ArsR family regulator